MKKTLSIVVLLCGMLSASAQHPIYPFFDDKGAVRIETTELNDASDTLISLFHRADDIVWSRVVYRVIDLRYKQNYQMYFPVNSDDPQYRSLFKVIIDAIADGLEVYPKYADNIKPFFDVPLGKEEIPGMLMIDDITADYSDDSTHYDISSSSAMLLHYNKAKDKLEFNFFPYENFAKNQYKYLIQEIIFFDRHTSRLYSKIIAIAPMQADKITNPEPEPEEIMDALMQSILFWIPFDNLRPYLARQYMIPRVNDNARMTFDEFFMKRLYASYLLGDSNMYNRMFLHYAFTEKEIKKEQQRVFDELLNFEQDLWEY